MRSHDRMDEVERPGIAILYDRSVVDVPFRMGAEMDIVRRLIDFDVDQDRLARDRDLLRFA